MSVRLQSRFARVGGYTCKLFQAFSRYQSTLCTLVATATKRDKIILFNPQIKVLNKRHDMMYRQPSVDEQAVLETNSATVIISLED